MRIVVAIATLAVRLWPAAAQTPLLPAISQPPASIPYHWRNVVIGGGGFVTGLVFSPLQRGLVYARTDVGGAYRSDDSGGHWLPLTDRFGRDDATYLGIESLALDPRDGKRLYLAAGMYAADWGGPAAIFRSTDKGRTFQQTAMPFRMGGNDNGRGCGERLAVDPHLGSVLFFGSRKAGLWRSTDAAVTWSHVDSFPVKDTVAGPGEGTGITFVLFDASKGTNGLATPSLYVGVASAGIGLYRSDDAGETWKLVPGTPKNLFPNRAVLDRGRSLVISFVDGVGPNGVTDGAVLRYNPATGEWNDISPLRPGSPGERRFGFGGLALDPRQPDTLMVTTVDRWAPTDIIFRSTDGGVTWKDVAPLARYTATQTPWVYWHRGTTGGHGWMWDIEIDPFDSGRVMYTTGEGIWGSPDVTAMDTGKPTHWSFPNQGFEETVPLAIISPPAGAHLLSAVGDIGGFRHDDLLQSPKGGFFVDPQLTSGSSLDFAGRMPALTVRVGYGDARVVRGGYSFDNGITWTPFATEPPGSRRGGGVVAISADGKTVVWSPDKGVPSWSTDWGRSWTVCAGLAETMRVVSDRVNATRFYSFDSATGALLVSGDAARTFTPSGGPAAAKGRSAMLAPTPGLDGDLWIGAGDRVYHTADAGATFATLGGMTRAYAIGFGMPATGSDSPAIYISGIAAGREGVYRSTGAGRTWSRIDDSEHQFGWKNAITGDPRVFGRLFLATGGRGIVYGEPATH